MRLRIHASTAAPSISTARAMVTSRRTAAPRRRLSTAPERDLTAAVLRQADANVVALQEVFDLATLDRFHDRVLTPAGVEAYPHCVCLPGNDGRGLMFAKFRLSSCSRSSGCRRSQRQHGLVGALESLELIMHRLKAHGIPLHLSEVKGPVMDRLRRAEFLDHLMRATSF